jgi:hypothetical protein
MKKNDVITVVAVTGAEYVGKFDSEDSAALYVTDPHIVTPDGNNLGFMPTVAMTGAPGVSQVKFRKTGIITFVPTADEVVKQYVQATSGIVLQ